MQWSGPQCSGWSAERGSLIFGAWPAWALTGRAAVTDLERHAGEEGRRRGGIRIGNALVIGQVALSLLLLASGGLFLKSAISAATADPGFRLDGGWLVEADPSLAGYDEARGRQSQLALVDRLRTVPGVEPVVLVTAPLILLASCLLASYVPALRATNVDPTVALRSE